MAGSEDVIAEELKFNASDPMEAFLFSPPSRRPVCAALLDSFTTEIYNMPRSWKRFHGYGLSGIWRDY